jgi:hypothetical protein
MPEKRTVQRARRKLRQGKSPSTAAGEFVREEIEHVREGKHGARFAPHPTVRFRARPIAARAGAAAPTASGPPASAFWSPGTSSL